MFREIRRIAMATGVIAMLGLAVSARAGIGVITVNQHETQIDTGCRYCPVGSTLCTQGCTEDTGGCRYNASVSDPNANPPRVGYESASTETPPFSQISSIGTNVDVFSYHVNPWTNNTNPPTVFRRWKGRGCQALAEYTFSGRPKILSTDMPWVESSPGNDGAGTDVAFYVDLVCQDAATGSRKGRVHFEHYDRWLNQRSEQGNCIDGWTSFVSRSRNALNAIASASCGVDHHPNGTLTRNTQKLNFSQPRGAANAPLTILKGYGYMGALGAGERLDPESYFRILGWKGVNLTRVWAVERWNGRVPGSPTCAPGQSEGPTPFAGTWQQAGGDYHLDQPNKDFYKGLRRFVQEAADRGIVVQLSVYDIHGLLHYPDPTGNGVCPGRFLDSPYNTAHNDNGYIVWNHTGNCGNCANAFGGEATEARGDNCKGPSGFVTNGGLQANHLGYVRRVAEEVGGMGNVMFEVINEAIAGLDWWDVTPRGDTWQLQQAENLKKALPIRVVRDAFNDHWPVGGGLDREPFSLHDRIPDQRVDIGPPGDRWAADNVRIVQSKDQVSDGTATIWTNSWLGYATSNGNVGSMSMSGSLPFPQPPTWTDLNVRAKLKGSTGSMNLSVAKQYGESVVVSFHPATGTLQLWEIGGCLAACDHGTINVTNPTESHEVRLKLARQGANQFLATVFLDGEETTLADVPVALNTQSGGIHTVGFSGSIGGTVGTPYPPGTHEVDNFEATYVCLTCEAAAGDEPGPVEQDASEDI